MAVYEVESIISKNEPFLFLFFFVWFLFFFPQQLNGLLVIVVTSKLCCEKHFTLLLADINVDISTTMTIVPSWASEFLFTADCLQGSATSSKTCLPSCIPTFGS